MNKNTVKTSKSAAALPMLKSMSRDELRATAKALGVKTGKNTQDTIANICAAIDEGKAHFKAQCTISFKPEGGTRTTYFGKTLRTYVSGPGLGDETWLTPDAAVAGSPAGPQS